MSRLIGKEVRQRRKLHGELLKYVHVPYNLNKEIKDVAGARWL